jgi:hypothetical protein
VGNGGVPSGGQMMVGLALLGEKHVEQVNAHYADAMWNNLYCGGRARLGPSRHAGQRW